MKTFLLALVVVSLVGCGKANDRRNAPVSKAPTYGAIPNGGGPSGMSGFSGSADGGAPAHGQAPNVSGEDRVLPAPVKLVRKKRESIWSKLQKRMGYEVADSEEAEEVDSSLDSESPEVSNQAEVVDPESLVFEEAKEPQKSVSAPQSQRVEPKVVVRKGTPPAVRDNGVLPRTVDEPQMREARVSHEPALPVRLEERTPVRPAPQAQVQETRISKGHGTSEQSVGVKSPVVRLPSVPVTKRPEITKVSAPRANMSFQEKLVFLRENRIQITGQASGACLDFAMDVLEEGIVPSVSVEGPRCMVTQSEKPPVLEKPTLTSIPKLPKGSRWVFHKRFEVVPVKTASVDGAVQKTEKGLGGAAKKVGRFFGGIFKKKKKQPAPVVIPTQKGQEFDLQKLSFPGEDLNSSRKYRVILMLADYRSEKELDIDSERALGAFFRVEPFRSRISQFEFYRMKIGSQGANCTKSERTLRTGEKSLWFSGDCNTDYIQRVSDATGISMNMRYFLIDGKGQSGVPAGRTVVARSWSEDRENEKAPQIGYLMLHELLHTSDFELQDEYVVENTYGNWKGTHRTNNCFTSDRIPVGFESLIAKDDMHEGCDVPGLFRPVRRSIMSDFNVPSLDFPSLKIVKEKLDGFLGPMPNDGVISEVRLAGPRGIDLQHNDNPGPVPQKIVAAIRLDNPDEMVAYQIFMDGKLAKTEALMDRNGNVQFILPHMTLGLHRFRVRGVDVHLNVSYSPEVELEIKPIDAN